MSILHKYVGIVSLVGILGSLIAVQGRGEVVLKTKEYREAERANPSFRAVHMLEEADRTKAMQEEGFNVEIEKRGRLVLRVGWKHVGVESPDNAKRDKIAADRLYEEGDRLVSAWNKKLGIKKKTFLGVEYVRTENGWSKEKSPTVLDPSRRWTGGGTAVGYILVEPY